TADDDLPHVAQLMFARPAQHIKVKKTITLLAPDLNEGIDLAAISLVEQRLIPTPGAMALMGLGGLVASRRRR
ncbi:MAG: PEP-CTERM sorting domain-containing protein, partial [Phycisphaerales bacterium]|nr:PEP-CTERM sorting domain-containing protein [Phycisphaerales bacterium]